MENSYHRLHVSIKILSGHIEQLKDCHLEGQDEDNMYILIKMLILIMTLPLAFFHKRIKFINDTTLFPNGSLLILEKNNQKKSLSFAINFTRSKAECIRKILESPLSNDIPNRKHKPQSMLIISSNLKNIF